MTKKAGIRELKNQTSRIVSEVREEMAEYVITSQGHPVAFLKPFTEHEATEIRRQEAEKAFAEMKSLAAEIAEAWSSPKSGVELLEEERS